MESKLKVILEEPKAELKLKLLLKHNYIQQAKQFVFELIDTYHVFFHTATSSEFNSCFFKNSETKGAPTYVVIADHLSSDLGVLIESDIVFVFELAEDNKFGMTDTEEQELIKKVLAYTKSIPSYTWTEQQAKGTFRAGELVKDVEEWIEEIKAISLERFFHSARFDDFAISFAGREDLYFHQSMTRSLTELVDWYCERQREYGWTESQVTRSILNYLHLWRNLNPLRFLQLAHASTLKKYDLAYKMIVRSYLKKNMDYFIQHIVPMEKVEKMSLEELFRLADLKHVYVQWLSDKLTDVLTNGHVSAVDYFLTMYGKYFSLTAAQIDDVFGKAMDDSVSKGDYANAIAIGESQDMSIEKMWYDFAELKKLK